MIQNLQPYPGIFKLLSEINPGVPPEPLYPQGNDRLGINPMFSLLYRILTDCEAMREGKPKSNRSYPDSSRFPPAATDGHTSHLPQEEDQFAWQRTQALSLSLAQPTNYPCQPGLKR